MTVLFDTSVVILLLRSKRPEGTEALLGAARLAIAGGRAVLPAVTVSEILLGERRAERVTELSVPLAHIPAAILPREAAETAGLLGGFLRESGATVPLPDLLIAATALWLQLPLLTWDGDFARSRRLALDSGSAHPGAALWRALEFHPASRQG